MKIRKYVTPLIAVVLLLALDQWTKYLATIHLKDQAPIPLWKDVFELHYLENRGAAFGILQGQRLIFGILTVAVVCLLIWFYIKIPQTKRYTLMRILTTVCMAGALGNFIDRMWHGYVVDFLYFKLIDFPIFNVADIYITCTAILFIVLFLFYYKEEDFQFLSRKKEALPKTSAKDSDDSPKEEEISHE